MAKNNTSFDFTSALKHFSLFLLVIVTLWMTPQIKNMDRRINDLIQNTSTITPSKDIIIVDIDQKTVNSAKNFPVSRGYIADAIFEIAKQKPKKVLVDIFLIADGSPEDDANLISAFNAFESGSLAISGMSEALTQGKPIPNPKFGSNARIVDSIISQDTDGFFRSLGSPYSNNDATLQNPARWLANQNGLRIVQLDQSVKPGSYIRYSLSDFTNENIPDLTGKIVIIGQVAKLLGLPVQYPLHGNLDRTEFIALAADTLLNGNEQKVLEPGILIVIYTLIALSGLSAAFFLVRNNNIFKITTIAGLLIMMFNLAAHFHLHIALNIIATLVVWKAAFFLTLAYKYRIVDAFREVLSGDLSPEEAWQWRVMKNHKEPVVLLGLNGIRRINMAGSKLKLFDNNPENIKTLQKAVSDLDTKDEISLYCSNVSANRIYKAIQPFENISLYQLQDITSENTERKRLSELAVTDQLTNCINKAGFNEQLDMLTARNQPYSIFILDLNGFKAANDTYGHMAGDRVLVECARRLQTALRSNDILARIGGDEFAVIALGENDTKNLLLVRDKLENAFGNSVHVDGNDIAIGVAIGFAQRKNAESKEQVLKAADEAMYARKRFMKSRGMAKERGEAA